MTIRFNVFAALSRWRHRGRAGSRRFQMMDLPALRDLPLGPGWFDSSWDLGQGLAVEVAVPGDPSFQAWIDAQARALERCDVAVRAPMPAQQLIEFVPVAIHDWAAPSPARQPLRKEPARVLDMAALELALDMPEMELEPM